MAKKKRTGAVDVDGVLNSYKSGWTGDACDFPDPPGEGAFAWLERLRQHFDVSIFSSRFKDPTVLTSFYQWVLAHSGSASLMIHLKIMLQKEPAIFYLDDRGIGFEGLWPDPGELINFLPWYRRTTPGHELDDKQLLALKCYLHLLGLKIAALKPMIAALPRDAQAAAAPILSIMEMNHGQMQALIKSLIEDKDQDDG